MAGACRIPDFLLYAADLPRYGYRRGDLLGVYALDDALLTAYVCGTLRSLEQVIGPVSGPRSAAHRRSSTGRPSPRPM